MGLASLLITVVTSVAASWRLVLLWGPRRRTWADQIGLTLGLTLAWITLTGLTLARLGIWSPSAVVCATAIPALLLLALSTINHQRFHPPRGAGAPTLAALAVSLAFMVLWGSYPHQNLLGERDEGVYMATALELARTGDFGWPEHLTLEFGFGAVLECLEYVGLTYDGFPRLLLYPGFYIEEPGFRVIPQFLGGYEPWLALAHRAGGEPFLFRVNAVLMGMGLWILFAAGARLVGPWPAVGAALLAGSVMAVSWSARSAGNEALTLPLIWSTVLAATCLLSARNKVRAVPWILFLLLTALGVTKIAGWFLFPVLAGVIGWAGSRPHPTPWGRSAAFLVLLSSGVVIAHAAAFCPHYLYGSFKHGPEKLGLSYPLLIASLPSSVIIGVVSGMLLGVGLHRIPRLQDLNRIRTSYLVVGFFGAVLAGRVILWYQRRHVALSGDDLVWSNAANLSELANYLPTGMSLVGMAGLLWIILARKSPTRMIFLSLGAVAMFLILNRNIDSNHPWAGRRWVPLVFPACCLGISFALNRLTDFAGRTLSIPAWIRRASTVCLVMVATAFIARPALPLTLTRHGDGLSDAYGQLTRLLPANAVVFANPSTRTRAWLPWLYARHEIPGYVIQPHIGAWSRAMPMMKELTRTGRPPVFLTDYPPAPWTLDQGFLIPAGQVNPTWLNQQETQRALPSSGSTETSATFYAYQLGKPGLRRGWMPWSPPPPPSIATRLLTSTTLDLSIWPIPGEMEGVFEGSVLSGVADQRGQPWTDGAARIYMGEIVQSLRHPSGHRTDKPMAYEFQVTLSAGTYRTQPVPTRITRDTFYPASQRIVWHGTVGPEPTTIKARIHADRLQSGTFFDIASLRPKSAPDDPGARVGLRIDRLTITPIYPPGNL